MKTSSDPVWDEVLTPEEFARREQIAMRMLDGAEGEEMREFHRWFCRRYPTPMARLRYVRRQVESIAATQEKITRAR